MKIDIPVSQPYRVDIAPGLLDDLGRYVSSGTAALVVTEEHVAPLLLERACRALRDAGVRAVPAILPAGEETKSLAQYAALLHKLAEAGLTRADTVVALGGGVIGDLAGFAAATWLRGIRLVQVPTTLLAMVDSSVGGKTAIDLPEGKNLVGAFHQPAAVVCDQQLLDTLPPDVLCDGCAEALKTAVLFDPDLFSHLAARGTDFDRMTVLPRCIACKRDAVCADEFDRGARQLLNLGHTAGHAIETLSGYRISHGHAVAIGLAIMGAGLLPRCRRDRGCAHKARPAHPNGVFAGAAGTGRAGGQKACGRAHHARHSPCHRRLRAPGGPSGHAGGYF